jgi:hypothetical protein
MHVFSDLPWCGFRRLDDFPFCDCEIGRSVIVVFHLPSEFGRDQNPKPSAVSPRGCHENGVWTADRRLTLRRLQLGILEVCQVQQTCWTGTFRRPIGTMTG